MPVTVERQPDQGRIVESLAEESEQPVADVAKLFEHEHSELALGAHVTKFLHIFAIRNVQEILREHAAQNSSNSAGDNPIPTV